jgi:hypothetical protein
MPIMRYLFISLVVCLLLQACSPQYARYINNYQWEDSLTRPDYSLQRYWAAKPDMKDPSDSIPEPLRQDYQPNNSIDVFFLHPTSFTDPERAEWNAPIADAELNAKTDYSSILFQASAFNEYRVFAPRYRQAHLRAYYTTDTTNAKAAFDTAYADIRRAFLYYLEHLNQGHPIIIASHSQGTTHALRLLHEFFDSSNLSNKLVAAYVMGMYIPPNYFSSLTLCSDPLSTGCLAGWRTFKQGYEPSFVKQEKEASWIVNPLSWTITDSMADYNLNKGAVLRKFNKVLPGVAAAEIHDGILWTPKLHFAGSFLLRTKNYHIGDINLYYLNIRYNLRQRVAAYLSLHHALQN